MLVVCVGDPDLRFSLRREASQRGLRTVTCFNFSDLWETVMTRRSEIGGLVLDSHHAGVMAASSAARHVGRMPVVLVGDSPSPLPFSNVTLARATSVRSIVGAVLRSRRRASVPQKLLS